MKNLATLALLGVVSAEQIMTLEQVHDEDIEITDCSNLDCPHEDAVCCEDLLYCCPEGYTCNPSSNECTSGDALIPASLLQKHTEKKIQYDTEALCAEFVKDFAKQPDWWFLGPKGGVTKMEINEQDSDWGFFKLKHSDWEFKYKHDGKTLSMHPTGKHIETPGGDFQCDPRTGAFYINWQEDGEDKGLLLFSAQTTERWLELPGWQYKDQWGNISPLTRRGHNFQIGDSSEWNFDFYLQDIQVKSKFRDKKWIPEFEWEGVNEKFNGLTHTWFDIWTLSYKTIEIFLE